MDWMDDGIEPRRNHDELMQIVVTRGEDLRSRRRRTMSLGAGGAVLLIALVAGVMTASHRAAETRVSTAASGISTTTALSPFAGSGPHGPLDFPLPPFVRPVTTVAGAVPTTSVVPPVASPSGGPATTVAAAASTPAPSPNTPAAVSTTTPAPPTPLHECARDQLVVDATTDKSLYLAGEKVMLVSTARNRSGVACGYSSYSFESVFTDGNGKALTLKSALVADNFRLEPLSPGQVLTQTREWDQQACTYGDDGTSRCFPAPPGTYKGSVRWSLPGGLYEATADFGLARLPVTVVN